VQRIEKTTPFLRDAYDESTMSPEQLQEEKMFSRIAMKDLEFVKCRGSNLGKGSYGEVQLAKHK